MHTRFDTTFKVLMGGSFQGGSVWNKPADDIDNCFKIYHMLKGKAILYSDNEQIELVPNNLYFINGYKITSQYCEEMMTQQWFHFIPDSAYLKHILKRCPLVTILDIQSFSSFIPVFNDLSTYFDRSTYFELPDPESHNRILAIEIQSLIQFSLAQILKKLTIIDFENSCDFNRLLPALEYINVHCFSNISLEMLAEKCFMSSNYFHRVFKKNFEITPFDYMMKMRMEKAIRLLIYTDIPVKQIAFTIGFEDEAYFSRTFSKIYNESPGRYRKNNLLRLP